MANTYFLYVSYDFIRGESITSRMNLRGRQRVHGECGGVPTAFAAGTQIILFNILVAPVR